MVIDYELIKRKVLYRHCLMLMDNIFVQMMELEDVIKKVEGNLKKEELEIISCEYLENSVQ